VTDVVCVASWNVDLVVRVPRPVATGETLLASEFGIGPGGKGSNAAVAAARQGARVALIARIGSDDHGRMGQELWRAEGIATDLVEVAEGEASGVAHIRVYPDGDNSIAVFQGANAGLGGRHALAGRKTLEACRVVMASCEVPLSAVTEAFRIAKETGAMTILNPAPARPLTADMLKLADVLTPNESELPVIAALRAGSSVGEGAQALLARGATAVIVTRGAAGCALYRAGSAPERINGWPMTVADTIGAGDTFTGALAAAIARGLSLSEAARWANAAAALSVTRHGAIGGMPTHDEVRSLLDRAEIP
jgi:ribokinase